jgi:iron(II)-dependent oxidoreductase
LGYGVEDLSGNVWEWTRSLGEDYPYPDDTESRAGREILQSTGEKPRVLRGGAFLNLPQRVRCAVRGDLGARRADGFVGFRVVVSSLL